MRCFVHMDGPGPIRLTVTVMSQEELDQLRELQRRAAARSQGVELELLPVFPNAATIHHGPPMPGPVDYDGPTGMTPEEFQHGAGELMAKFMARHGGKASQARLMADIERAAGKKKPKPGRRSK